MSDPLRNIVRRFPENEDVIRELMQTDLAFDALCQEYASINKKLEEVPQMKSQDVTVQRETLRKRRVAIEEELLTVIEGYRPD